MRIKAFAVAIALLLGLFGAVEAQALTPLRVIVFPGGFNWPIWAAQKEGFFHQEGVSVKVTPTPSSVYQMTGLLKGKFDIAMTAFDNVVAYDVGEGAAKTSSPAHLFAFMGGDDGFLSLVVPDSIHSYAQLKGRRLAVDSLTTGYAFVLRRMLAEHGLKEGDYRLVSAGGVLERWKAMLEGKFAGTLLVTPFDILARAKGMHPLGYAIGDLHHYQGVVGATRRGWAKGHRAALDAYIRAYTRALTWLYNRSHRAAALEILEHHVPHMTPALAAKTYRVLLGPSGGFFPKAKLSMAGMRTVLALRKEYGAPKKKLDNPKNFYSMRYYDQAMKR